MLDGTFWIAALSALAIFMALSGLDDLLVDLVFHGRSLFRLATIYRRHPRARADRLPAKDEQSVAILIPAWREEAVIGAMLRHLRDHLLYGRYHVYVGCYPNDPGTYEAVAALGAGKDWLSAVVMERPGPTSKADCLNALYAKAVQDKPTIFVLHDAEDVVHPFGLKVINHLIGRFDMVQLPVIPLERPGWDLIGGHYMDEFAEAHAKDLIAREAMCRQVPSAGVGCAFNAQCLAKLAQTRGGLPFDPASLTEDYATAWMISRAGGKTILARIDTGVGSGPVATREYFPNRLGAAVRQKARWYLGIVFQGWRHLGWQGSLAGRHALLRDRKAPFCALITLACYGLALIWGMGFLAGSPPAIPAVLVPLMMFNAALLVWRLGHRMAFSMQLYGPRQAFWVIPRLVVGNFINALAAARACRLALLHILTGRPLVWQKTDHQFPAPDDMRAYRARLGALLIAKGDLTPDQLDHALVLQRQQGGRLGEILIAEGMADPAAVDHALSSQS